MNIPHKIKEVDRCIKGSDYTDVKVFEGKATLREFIASMLSYHKRFL